MKKAISVSNSFRKVIFAVVLALSGFTLSACSDNAISGNESSQPHPGELAHKRTQARLDDNRRYSNSHQYEVSFDLTAVCLEGVQYWYNGRAKSGLMAPRYDAKTLQVKTCPKGYVED